MKHTIQILATLLCIFSQGCASSSTAPLNIEGVRATIVNNLFIMQTGINAEDIFLASQPISDQFTMDNNAATRYASEWTGRGVGDFRNFWNNVFIDNANIDFSIMLTDIELREDVATVYCATQYSSVRPDIIPPEVRISTEDDFLQFERSGGKWLLRRWEASPVPIHGEGSGNSL